MGRGRTRGFSRDDALEAAMLLFWLKGYSATSVSELCDVMGIASPSMYAAFGNKEQLFTEAMALFHSSRGCHVKAAVDQAQTAREAVEAFMTSVVVNYTEPSQPLGCMATLASVDHVGSPSLSQMVRDGRAGGVVLLIERMRQGIDRGEIPATVDVELVVRGYVAVTHGLSLQARDGVSRNMLLSVVRTMMAGFDAIVGKC